MKNAISACIRFPAACSIWQTVHYLVTSQSVSWSLTSPFSTNMTISETIGDQSISKLHKMKHQVLKFT